MKKTTRLTIVSALTALAVSVGALAPASAATVKDTDTVFLDMMGYPLKGDDKPTGKAKKVGDLVKVDYSFGAEAVQITWTMKAPITQPTPKKADSLPQAFSMFIGSDYSTNDGIYIGGNDVDAKPSVRFDFEDTVCKSGTMKIKGKKATATLPWSCINSIPGYTYEPGQTVPLMVAAAVTSDRKNGDLFRDDTAHITDFVLN